MSDFIEQFINSIDSLSVEDLQKLHSIVSARLPKEKAPTENKDLGNDTINCFPWLFLCLNMKMRKDIQFRKLKNFMILKLEYCIYYFETL